ncbi:MAG: N-acetyltransferase [Candidatus Eisenbacteria bacterium]|nr:N-acetyltransferase [Candidatus Eisenbacteria bacterium]
MVEIRRARRSDLDTVIAIYNREVEHSTSTFDTEPRAGRGAVEWFESHASDAYPLIVADEGGDVVGWASLTPWSPRGAYARTAEGSLFIREGDRGRGVGKALTQALIEHARAAGHGVLIARAETGNEHSRRLLLGAGFRSVGVMRRVGEKFGRVLDVEILELQLD